MTSGFEFRDYQEAAINTGVKFFENKDEKHSIEVIPTGGGKSVVIGAIATNLPGKTLVLQPSKEILAQNYKKAQAFMKDNPSFGEFDLGVYSASFDMRQKRRLTFATIGSIFGKAEEFAGFDRFIMDECDLVNPKGGQYEKFFNNLKKPLLGLTDSPYRLHPPSAGYGSTIKFIHRTRPRVFSKIIHLTQNKDLFSRGYLSKIEYVKENFEPEQLTLNSTGAEFTDASVKLYAREHDLVGKMARNIREIDTKHVLAVCNFIEEAFKLQARLESVGVASIVVHGGLHPRDLERMQNEFTTGLVRIAIVVGKWLVGFDFPALDGLVNDKITNSARLYKQTAGRLVRLHEGKQFSRYIDMGGNVQRFGKVEEFEIVGEPGKERLKSNVGFLTGVDLKTRYDIEAGRANGQDPYFEKLTPADGTTVMKFGKYKGNQISAVPVGYLFWLAKEGMDMQAKRMASAEIGRRNLLKKGMEANG